MSIVKATVFYNWVMSPAIKEIFVELFPGFKLECWREGYDVHCSDLSQDKWISAYKVIREVYYIVYEKMPSNSHDPEFDWYGGLDSTVLPQSIVDKVKALATQELGAFDRHSRFWYDWRQSDLYSGIVYGIGILDIAGRFDRRYEYYDTPKNWPILLLKGLSRNGQTVIGSIPQSSEIIEYYRNLCTAVKGDCFNTVVPTIGTTLDILLDYKGYYVHNILKHLFDRDLLNPVTTRKHINISNSCKCLIDKEIKIWYGTGIYGYNSALSAGLLSEENLDEKLMAIPYRPIQKYAMSLGVSGGGTKKSLVQRIQKTGVIFDIETVIKMLNIKELRQISKSTGTKPEGRKAVDYIEPLNKYYDNLFKKIRECKIGIPELSMIIRDFLIPQNDIQ